MIRPAVDQLVIPHAAFSQAQKQIEQCFKFAQAKGEAEGLAIIGESGTGKTRVLRRFADRHPTKKTSEGDEVPILFASVPSAPTVKSLAGVMLAAIGVPDPERGTENEKTRRLQKLIQETGTRMIMIDEFQHFVDQGTHKVMHHVADWLKGLIDHTRTTLIVAGLPSCMAVIDQNVQLARRFSAPLVMPRFDWKEPDQRKQFRAILREIHSNLSSEFELDALSNEDMAYRLYLATGGLIGYLIRLIRQVERDCCSREAKRISMEDLHKAHMEAIWSTSRNSGLPRPFEPGFVFPSKSELCDSVQQIGVAPEPSVSTRRITVKGRSRSISDLLVNK